MLPPPGWTLPRSGTWSAARLSSSSQTPWPYPVVFDRSDTRQGSHRTRHKVSNCFSKYLRWVVDGGDTLLSSCIVYHRVSCIVHRVQPEERTKQNDLRATCIAAKKATHTRKTTSFARIAPLPWEGGKIRSAKTERASTKCYEHYTGWLWYVLNIRSHTCGTSAKSPKGRTCNHRHPNTDGFLVWIMIP